MLFEIIRKNRFDHDFSWSIYLKPKSADNKHFIPAIDWIEWELSWLELKLHLAIIKRKESITGRRNLKRKKYFFLIMKSRWGKKSFDDDAHNFFIIFFPQFLFPCLIMFLYIHIRLKTIDKSWLADNEA